VQARGLVAVLGALLIVSICVIVWLVAARPEASASGSGSSISRGKQETSEKTRPTGAGVVAPPNLSAAEIEARNGEVRKPEKAKALAAVALDRAAKPEERQEAFGQLAAAGAEPSVLFPLVVEFSNNKEVGFSDRAVEALASMLERGHKAPDEAKATEILVAASKPPAGNSTRIAAARGLGRLRSKQAVEALTGMLPDSERLVRKFAIDGLKPLAGQDFGYVYSAEPAGQAEAIAKWGAWAKTYEPKAP
jgi:hypothetical protein